MYKNILKRFFDIVFSIIMIIILIPLFVAISISIKIDSKGPIFFSQKRVGKNRKIFKIIKFRSMIIFDESYYSNGAEMKNEDRITRVGLILRKTSLDELPQLFNILLGHMSLIGPRPTLEYQVNKYNSHQMRRLDVKPGLTGLAQVNGRNSLTWEEKINYDVQYTREISFILDLKIFIKTIFVVIRKDKTNFELHDELSKHDGSVIEDVK